MLDRYGEFIPGRIHNVHIILVYAANFQCADTEVFTDPMILMNDIVAYFEFGITFNALGIIHAFRYFTSFTLLLGEHFSFRNDDQMHRGQLKPRLQIALQ
ncbi:hypothetical protein D3C77_341890 [compost metagenome]